MPKQNTPQLSKTLRVVQSGQTRIFVQFDPSPLEAAEYFGRLTLTDNIGQARTESDIIEVPSDDFRNEWIKIAEISRSTERGSFSGTQLADQDLSEAWDELQLYNTAFNMHVLIGDSQAPQDFQQWRSKFVLGNARVLEVLRGESSNAQQAADNAQWVINLSGNYWDIYPVGTVEFADLAGATVTKNLNDVAIRLSDSKRYSETFGITTNAAATTPSAAVYVRNDQPTTISQTDITALSTDGEVSACAIVGSYLIAIRNDGTESHLYSTLDDVRQGNDNFTEVTSGWVAASGGNAIYAANAANILVAGNGGYVYKIPRVSAAAVPKTAGGVTTQNLAAIHGFGNQVVAVGASSAIIYSNDLGNTWSAASAPTAGLAITTVQVIGEGKWFIGTGSGVLYYTEDGGVNWTTIGLEGGISNIVEIKMYSRNADFYFGYLIGTDATNTLIYRTTDSGNTWNYQSPDVRNVTTTFTGVATPSAIDVLTQNELVVAAETVLGFGIN